jgi:hypothetical protein
VQHQQVTRYPLLQGYLIPRPLFLRRLLEKIITATFVEIWDRGIFVHDRTEGRIGLSFDPMVYSATETLRASKPISAVSGIGEQERDLMDQWIAINQPRGSDRSEAGRNFGRRLAVTFDY